MSYTPEMPTWQLVNNIIEETETTNQYVNIKQGSRSLHVIREDTDMADPESEPYWNLVWRDEDITVKVSDETIYSHPDAKKRIADFIRTSVSDDTPVQITGLPEHTIAEIGERDGIK